MNTRSIRFRLTGWYAGLLVLVMVLFGAYTWVRLDHFLRVVLRSALDHRAEQIVRDILPEIPKRGEAHVGAEIEKRFTPAINDRFVRVTRRGGAVLYLSGTPNDGNFSPEQVPALPAGAAQASTREQNVPNTSALLISTLPGSVAGQDYAVEVGTSLAASNRVLRALLLTLGAGLPVLTGLAILGGYVLMRRGMKPVQDIIVSAQDITLHHLERRLPVTDSGDEISELSKVLNQMIARLDESFQHVTRFTADASHELRTPLAVIRGIGEMGLKETRTPAEYKEAMGSMLEEVDRLTTLVDTLLRLSHGDAGTVRLSREPVDLGQLARDVVSSLGILAEERNQKLTIDAADGVSVAADRLVLREAITNVVDNAIKYSPSASAIAIRVRVDGERAILEVVDEGPGIAAEHRQRIFDRFFRLDEGRSRDSGGTGLGLAIAKWAVDVNGGQISVEGGAAGGSVFRIVLPSGAPRVPTHHDHATQHKGELA